MLLKKDYTVMLANVLFNRRGFSVISLEERLLVAVRYPHVDTDKYSFKTHMALLLHAR